MKRFISIDPGNEGAIVFWDVGVVVGAGAIPLVAYGSRKMPNRGAIRTMIEIWKPDAVVIERVTPGPADGPGNAGSLMLNLGVLVGCCAGYRVEFVRPAVWKGYAGLLRKPKKASVEKAKQKHPEAEELISSFSHPIDLSDAILIGDYFLRVKAKSYVDSQELPVA